MSANMAPQKVAEQILEASRQQEHRDLLAKVHEVLVAAITSGYEPAALR